jgi:branched-chain amino acid aminotransferase
MATESKTYSFNETSTLNQLEHLAAESTVFISMPFIRGITPRRLVAEGRKETSSAAPGSERYSGIFCPDEIGLPVFDHGLLYGDAVFEGILIHHERLFRWREHLQRLYASAERLGIQVPYDPAALTEQVLETVRSTIKDHKVATYLRLVVTRGIGDLGINPARCSSSVIYCIASRIQLYPESLYDQGIKLALCRTVRRSSADVLDPRIKSCNYLNNILALLETSGEACNEVLMLTRDGYVAEASTDNLFVVTKRPGWEEDSSKVTVATPVPDYCLNGITRNLVLEYAHTLGFRTEEQATILPSDLMAVDKEAFLTGTAAGLIPVITLDGRPIGDGTPGPVTRKLRCLLSLDLENPVTGLSLYAGPEVVSAYLESPGGSQGEVALPGPDFIRNMFATIDGRDWASLEKFFGRNITYERPGYAPLVGYDRVHRFYREERVIASGRHILSEIVMDGSCGASWGRFVGEHKNGSPIDEGFADTYKFERGKIKLRRSYFFRPAV